MDCVASRKRAASEAYRVAVTADPRFALAFARLAQIEASYFAQFGRAPERLDSAQAHVNRALALDPTLAEAHLAAGYVAYFGFFDYDRALLEFERVRQAQPNNGELLTILATIQMHMGRWQDARSSFLRAMRTAPRSPDAIAPLAAIETMLGHYDEAERLADRELQLAPDYLAGHVQRSYSIILRGDTVGGRAALREAARKLGTTPVLIALVHRFRNTLWYFDPALGDSLATLRPGIAGMDSGSYYSARSQVAWQRGDVRTRSAFADSARLIWEARIRRSPNEAKYHVELAHTYAALGRPDDARREADLAVTLLPVSKDAYLGTSILGEAAFVYAASGATDAAIDRFEQLLSHPAPISPQLLAIDSRLRALHRNPRFQHLLKASLSSPAS